MQSNAKFQKYVLGQARGKFRKQCLRSKNILFESDQLQIGCKIVNFYDFYSSTNYLQVNLFIGNKTDRPLDSFRLEFRGTNNLQLYHEEKVRAVKERTQYKERLIVGCNNYEEEILLLMDFQSALATLKNTALPITLFSFCMFGPGQSIPPSLQTETDLQKLLEHKYEFTQENRIAATSSLFKKDIAIEIEKYLPNMVKICDGVYLGQFCTRSLINQYTLTVKVQEDRSLRLGLSSNQYHLFDSIFANLRFLFE